MSLIRNISMGCAICLGIVMLIILICVGFYTVPLFDKGIRATDLYTSSTDPASIGESCSTQHFDVYLWNLTNWNTVRAAPVTAPVTPTFQEVGPYNFTRQMCAFDKTLVDGSAPPTTTERIYYGPLSVVSVNADGSPGIDTDGILNVVNPAYITVVNTLRRMSNAPLDGLGGERLLQAQLCSGVLQAIMTGLLAPTPDGFIPTTWVGAIPAVMQTVEAGLQTLVAKTSFLSGIIISSDSDSYQRLARYLWARPMGCLNYSVLDNGLISGCSELSDADGLLSNGIDLTPAMNVIADPPYQGFEVGTPSPGTAFVRSTITGSQCAALWDTTNELAVNNVDGILVWNASRTDPASAAMLMSAFNLATSDFFLVSNWVGMFQTVTPGLVVPQLLGPQYTAADANLLAWSQLANCTVSAQRGNRPDGLPKTVHDVSSQVPFTFEISFWAASYAKMPVGQQLFTPQQLQFVFTGTSNYAPYVGQTCSMPLFNSDNMLYFLQLVPALPDPTTLNTITAIWQFDATEAANMFAYLQWLLGVVLLNGSGPVVQATAQDILFDHDDNLLKVLVAAGKLNSSRSGVLYAPTDYLNKSDAILAPPALPQRVWLGTGEATSLVDVVPQSYIDAIGVAGYHTTDSSGELTLLGPTLNVWAQPTTVIGFSGERFPMPINASSVLSVWNDDVARTLTWSCPTGAMTALEGISAFEFQPTADTLAPNPLYYQGINGMFNLSIIKPTDVFVSLPRFSGVDPTILNCTVTPTASTLPCCQQWTIFVQPDAGLTIGKDIATQVNFLVPTLGLFPNLSLPAGMMPLFWQQDREIIDPTQAATFSSGYSLTHALRIVAFVLGPLILVCCLCGAGICFARCGGGGRRFGERDTYVEGNPIAMNETWPGSPTVDGTDDGAVDGGVKY